MANRNPTPPDSPEPIRSPAMKTHDNVTGADMQKVTDESTEKESQDLGKAATLVQRATVKGKMNDLEVGREKIVLNKEDVKCLMDHMEVSKVVAEKVLREQKGNLFDALVAMVNS